MKYRYTLEVDDNFTKGNCPECPLSYEEYNEHYRDWNLFCVLGAGYDECPLESLENDDDLLKAVDNIDYTHLLGYPSEVVAVEIIKMVKDVIHNDYMAFAKAVQEAEIRMRESAPEGNIVSFKELKCYYKGKTNEKEE